MARDYLSDRERDIVLRRYGGTPERDYGLSSNQDPRGKLAMSGRQWRERVHKYGHRFDLYLIHCGMKPNEQVFRFSASEVQEQVNKVGWTHDDRIFIDIAPTELVFFSNDAVRFPQTAAHRTYVAPKTRWLIAPVKELELSQTTLTSALEKPMTSSLREEVTTVASIEAGFDSALGGRGEGAIHKRLKEGFAQDPLQFMGERLELIDVEFQFESEDRLDLLFRDVNGNYVCVEIEPDVAQGDIVPFLQAMKYRALTSFRFGVPQENVRVVIAAQSFSPSRFIKQAWSFGIELRVIRDSLASKAV